MEANTAQDQLDPSCFHEYQKAQLDHWIGSKLQEPTNLNEAVLTAPLHEKLKHIMGASWRTIRDGQKQPVMGNDGDGNAVVCSGSSQTLSPSNITRCWRTWYSGPNI